MSEIATELETSRGWRVIREFRHDGVIWSPGAPPPPDLQRSEIESLARTGYLVPLEGDNPFPPMQPGAPQTAAEYLRAQDALVLRNIRRFRPRRNVVRQILDMAVTENRSKTFLEALRLHLELPVED